MKIPFQLSTLSFLLATAFLQAGCGSSSEQPAAAQAAPALPAAPTGMGQADTAPVPDEATVPPFVDNAASNQRGDARYATLQTNAGVRAVQGFLQIWQPSTMLVDARAAAPANGAFPAVAASNWSGLPGDATDGKVLNSIAHNANIQYVVNATSARTPAQELAAYLDDRRAKGYSISDGMGPLTTQWRSGAQQTTSITAIAGDATTVRYDDTGNDVGAGSATNTTLGLAVDFINNIGENGSTEPAKRFYKYARPWRWSSSVIVVPALNPAKSTTPNSDGGYISGHSAEAVRKAIAMAYLVPQRYQEMLARGLELGENRILAGMHSPMDVIGGRILGQSVAAASIATGANAKLKQGAYQQAQTSLQSALKLADATALNTYAHSYDLGQDRFADRAANRQNYLRRLTFGLPVIGDTTKAAVVPKGAEVLLETRLPYLDAVQRRVVLKTTALPSGYPVMDDAEGWGRLNLFAAADGYGAFNGDVSVTMDASLGGFHAEDSWNNNIGGKGLLVKQGSGTLHLTGANSYSGGTVVRAGTLSADSANALGEGDVYVAGGKLASAAKSALTIAGNLTQTAGGALDVLLGAGTAGQVYAAGNVVIDKNSTLNIRFAPAYKPAAGTVLRVLSGKTVKGAYGVVNVDGVTKVTVSYDSTTVTVRIDG